MTTEQLLLSFAIISPDIITVMSWAQWRLRSPAASRLCTQPIVRAQVKESIKAPRHWPLWGEFTGDRWIPRTKGQLHGKRFHLMTSSYRGRSEGLCYIGYKLTRTNWHSHADSKDQSTRAMVQRSVSSMVHINKAGVSIVRVYEKSRNVNGATHRNKGIIISRLVALKGKYLLRLMVTFHMKCLLYLI